MDCHVKKVEEMLISMNIIGGSGSQVESHCQSVFKSMDRINAKTKLLEDLLEKHAGQLEYQKELTKQFEDLKDKLFYLKQYFPPGLVAVNNEEQEEVLVPSPVEKKKPSTTPIPRKALTEISNGLAITSNQHSLSVPKILFHSCESSGSSIDEQKTKKSPNTGQDIFICHVSSEEFDQVPSYMKGRLTLSTMNEFVDLFNLTLSKKYQLLKKAKKSKSKPELEQCLAWKEQERGELVGSSFCTADDFDKLSATKLGNKKYLTIITVLRHLKRMKEVRNIKIIYYVSIS